jgi:hypothetical protein
MHTSVGTDRGTLRGMADVQQELGNWDVALNHRSKSAKRDHVERET